MKISRGEGELFFQCTECGQDEHDELLQIATDEGYIYLCKYCVAQGLEMFE
jgi:hypothetical protein